MFRVGDPGVLDASGELLLKSCVCLAAALDEVDVGVPLASPDPEETAHDHSGAHRSAERLRGEPVGVLISEVRNAYENAYYGLRREARYADRADEFYSKRDPAGGTREVRTRCRG